MVTLEGRANIDWGTQPNHLDLAKLQTDDFWNLVSHTVDRPHQNSTFSFFKKGVQRALALPPMGDAPTPKGIEKLIHYLESIDITGGVAPAQE